MRIFKILMLVAVVIATTSSINKINAQDTTPVASKYGWGITNGISVNNFTYDQPHNGLNLGYTAGGFIDRSVGKNLKLRLNLGYTGAGGQLTTFKDDTRYGFDPMFTFKNVKQSSYLLHSIDSWLSLFYERTTANNWKYYVGIGGGMENKFAETERYQKTGEFVTGVYGTVQNQQMSNRFENYWFNSNITSGIELPAYKHFNIIVEARYIYGLSAARPNYSYIEYAGVAGEVRTNAFQLTVGIRNMFKPGNYTPKVKAEKVTTEKKSFFKLPFKGKKSVAN